VKDVATADIALPRARTRVQNTSLLWAGAALPAAALAGLLGWLLTTWPPHEDETLALFVGRAPFGDAVHTVIAERGGAPLHFIIAWTVVHLGGGLTSLRIVSLVFAVASVPAIAVLGSRLADAVTGAVAAVLAAGSWVLLFQGVYGRMYSLFLFTSVISFLALVVALDRGGRKRFALWGLALLAMLASHPYALLVVGAQVLFVLLRRVRLREALTTLAAVGVAGIPFWWADLVLRTRFDVGVGGGGPRLGSPRAVLHYLWWVAGDFSAGHRAWSAPVLLLALAGAILLARRRRDSALLVACVLVVPALAFTLATLGSAVSPEARHLIFALPFFSLLVAVAVVEAGRARPPVTAAVAVAAVTTLLVGEIRWAHEKTPQLFDGDPPREVHARAAAADWLAANSRADDVLLGYEPLFLLAWERNSAFSTYALPRADPALLTSALRRVPQPLGRGVWVLDASDTTNLLERQTIPFALPRPASAFEARVYGPYLVIRSRRALVTRTHYLDASEAVMRLGRRLQIGDADVNLGTILQARLRL
jgi:4-amino-4-deoxy-L-arabinose transferase-like glycosyltransferase